MSVRKAQSAYEQGRVGAEAESLEALIKTAMYRYLREDLGLPESVARDRAAAEVTGKIGTITCNECESAGILFAGTRVLDLGAGLGGLSAEIARRGARLVSLEPGSAWRRLAAQRLRAVGNGELIGAIGEYIPLADNSVDLIVSMQVLEHVQNPAQVIREAYRVLKPGGLFFMTYENYLSFWEPHYRVRWLPLLPKPIGTVYLRALGRNPVFLQEAITYTTFPAVRRAFLNAGFECMRLRNRAELVRSRKNKGLKWQLINAAAVVSESGVLKVLAGIDYLNRTLRTNVHEFMRKPDLSEQPRL